MAGRSRQRKTLPRHLWDFLTSRKLAVVLLLLAAAMLLLGLWLPQVPADLDEAGLAQWWTAAGERYGTSLDLYQRLGLLHLFSTPTFLALLAALLLNTLACTLDRLGTLWRAATRRPAVRLPDSAYEVATWQVPAVPVEQARQAQRRRGPAGISWASWFPVSRAVAVRALRRRGYRLWEEAGPPHYLYGERFRLASLGTVLSHLGLFLLLLAALLHAGLSWRERLRLDPASFPQGSSPTRLQHRPTCTVLNAGSEDNPGAPPTLLVQEGASTVQGLPAPAAPVSACGANFYLDSYGLALQMEAYDEGGQPLEVVFPPSGAALLRFAAGVSEGTGDVPARGWHIILSPPPRSLLGSADEPLGVRVEQAGQGAPLFEGTVDPREGLALPGGRLAFRQGTFLVVEVVHDPGLAPFLAAGLALAGGSGLTLLFPRRRLWARLDEDGTLRVCLDVREAGARSGEIAALGEALGPGEGGAP